MRRWLPIAVIALLAGAAVASTWSLTHIRVSSGPTDVDHVTLYQGGLAAISLVRAFDAPGGDTVLDLALPTSTVFDTLTVDGAGVAVRELRSTLAADPTLRAGDQLTVHLDDGSHVAGAYVALQDGQLTLATEQGTTVVQLPHVSAVEVAGRHVDPGAAGVTTVSVLVNAPAGRHSVRVAYLANGAGWAPSHILDPGTGAMTFFATLTGLQDWSNVTLDLVAGQPRMVYGVGSGGDLRYQGLVTADAFSGAGASSATGTYAPNVGPSESMGALHRYHYQGTVSLARGQTVRLPVVTGQVDVLRHYLSASGSTYASDWSGLPEMYQLRNTMGETLPSGPVRAYLGGEWVGSDTLPALGKREQGNITVAQTDDAKARVQVLRQDRGDPVFDDPSSPRHARVTVTTTYELQVGDFGDTAWDVRATFHANEGGTTKVLSTSPPAQKVNGALVWDATVAGGATSAFDVTVQTVEDTYV